METWTCTCGATLHFRNLACNWPRPPVAPARLRFHLLASTPDQPVLTGHADGLVTLNIVEADDVERERRRAAFDEPWRTLQGHLRHHHAEGAPADWAQRHISPYAASHVRAAQAAALPASARCARPAGRTGRWRRCG